MLRHRIAAKGFAYGLIMIFAVLLGSLAVLTLEIVESHRRLTHAARHRVTAWYLLNHILHRLIWAQNSPAFPVRPLQDPHRWSPAEHGWSRLTAPPWPPSALPKMNIPYRFSIKKRSITPHAHPPETTLQISVTIGAQKVSQTVRLGPLHLDAFPLGLGPRASGPPPRTWLRTTTAHTLVLLRPPFTGPFDPHATTLWLPPQMPFPRSTKLSPDRMRRTPPWPPLKRWFHIHFDTMEGDTPTCRPGLPLVLQPSSPPHKMLYLDSLDLCRSRGLTYQNHVLISTPPGFNGIILNRAQMTISGTFRLPCRNLCRDPFVLWIVNQPRAELNIHSPIRIQTSPHNPCPPRIAILNFGTLNIRFTAPDPRVQIDLFSTGAITIESAFGLAPQWEGTLYLDGPFRIRTPLIHSPSTAPSIPISHPCPFHHWVWDVRGHSNPFAPPSSH